MPQLNYQPNSRLQPTPVKKHRAGWLVILVMLVGIGAGAHWLDSKHLLNPKTLAHSLSQAPAQPTAAQLATMNSQINQVIAVNPNMQIGVAITNINNNKAYNYGVSDPFIAASVGKLITASLYLHDVESGQYTLSQSLSYDTAQNEMYNMIVNSDNTAWLDFNNLLGDDSLQSYANSIGLNNYDPSVNTLTASDISALLSKLYQGQLLNQADTQLMLADLKAADSDYPQYIVSAIPKGVTVYHKVGWLIDRVHDVAIITNGTRSYSLVIFTKANDGNYDELAGERVFHQITQITSQTFLPKN